MSTLTISLPQKMKEWVESQAEGGEYSSASDYVRDLIRRDRNSRNEELTIDEFNEMLELSFKSGVSNRNLREIFDDALQSANNKREVA